ncbi:MAG: hypothetical protein HW414_614 [Dehalococcoidia bacterium]|nr:hypothetical protein [Dehalococcoidia bacterium]
MTQAAEVITSNLTQYPHIAQFFGRIIKQRLSIDCYTHGMLTANLLENSGLTILDQVLQLGLLHCRDFKHIFKSVSLPKMAEVADAQIGDLLAEVKAFEFLHAKGFTDIAKIRRSKAGKTVDFTAKKNGQNHAIEVTRLGLAQSDKKQPVYALRISTLRYAHCEDADGFEFTRIDEGSNKERLTKEISDALNNKYPQILEFCRRETGKWKGILFISDGRGYFPARKYENKAYDQTPERDFFDVLKEIWESAKQEQEYYRYLDCVAITRGKNLDKVIRYPIS